MANCNNEMIFDRRATGAELAKPPMRKYVVLAVQVVDTAVVNAEGEQAAIDRYELPEEFANLDIMLWAMPEEEFKEQVEAAIATQCPDKVEPAPAPAEQVLSPCSMGIFG